MEQKKQAVRRIWGQVFTDSMGGGHKADYEIPPRI